MNRYNKLVGSFGLFLAMAVMLVACERKEKEEVIVAGKGGAAELRITPKHHGTVIDSCKVYIKYNAQDKPTSYDDSAWCVPVGNNSSVATFSGLKKGKYYLYGVGYDPDIFEAVTGGAPYTIETEDVQEYTLSVTETH